MLIKLSAYVMVVIKFKTVYILDGCIKACWYCLKKSMFFFVIGVIMGTILGQEVKELPRMTHLIQIMVDKTKRAWNDKKESLKD